MSFSNQLFSDSSTSNNQPVTNHSPNSPLNPSPADGAVDVSTRVTLTWTCTDPDAGDTVKYDVYFGLSSPPTLLASNVAITTRDVGIVNPNSKFYWQIKAKDNHGLTTPGPIWRFTTGSSY
jgi:hypothetical protein